MEHRIVLIPGAIPIRQKDRTMNPQLQLLVKAELERLLNAGFITSMEITDWVFDGFGEEKNGKLRVCVDYRILNACTQNDHFPLPFITLYLKEVRRYTRYTFIEGYASYNRISIALQDIHMTAFIISWGVFLWVVMPFGLYNVCATF